MEKEIQILFRKRFIFSTTDSPTSLYIFLLQLSLSLPRFDGKRAEVVRISKYPDSKQILGLGCMACVCIC